MKHTFLGVLLFLTTTPMGVGLAQEKPPTGAALPLDSFLHQVKKSNPGLLGALESSTGSLDRSEEGNLLVSPSAFANATLSSDSSISAIPIPGFNYDKAIVNTYSVGLAQQTTFGLQAKVYYNFSYFHYTPYPGYNISKPAIELTQPLWGNGFGRSTRATQDLLEAQALSSHFMNRFQAKSTLVDAEVAYWRLAVARQAVAVQSEALERANKIHDWTLKRTNLQLADGADELQSKALLEVRKLEYEAALNEQRDASRVFNTARNIDSSVVSETLVDFTPEILNRLTPPPRAGMRDDVRAAQQAERATAANSIVASEKDSPTLDLFASYALNGRQDGVLAALTDPFTANRPTQAVGVKFSVPLNFGTVSDSKRGWALERSGAEKTFQKKAFDEDQTWKNLNERLSDARRRYELARALETAQKAKLQHEKGRLQHGRTTTYQVLLFEQDYSMAQLSRIKSEADILTLLAQMKLFGDES